MSRAAQKLMHVLAGCLVAAATAVAFTPVLSAGFVNWDDYENLLQNSHYRGLSSTQLRWMFTTFHTGPYQPLSWISLGADYLLWGLDPFGYHLTNLLLHVGNAVLLYFLSVRILRLCFPDHHAERARDLIVFTGACGAALLFSLHPLRVESVAWITERRDVLCGLFFLLTLHGYFAAASAATATKRRCWLALSIALFALSLLSKAISMTLPLVLILVDAYPLRRLTWDSSSSMARGTWTANSIWLEKVPFFILAFMAGTLALLGQHVADALETMSRHGVAARIAQAIYGLAFYLCKTVFPVNLVPLYRFPVPFGLLAWQVVISAVVLVVLGALFWRFRHRFPAGLAASTCYVILLSPVLGFAQSGVQITADRYSYLASMPLCLLIGGGVSWLASTSTPPAVGGLAGFVLAAVSALGTLTWRQCHIWRSSIDLWTHTLAVDPNNVTAHYNLGNALAEVGRQEEAVRHFQQAIQIEPRNAKVHYNLANALSDLGRLDFAIEHYETAVRSNPRFPEAHYNLANALTRLDQVESAIDHYQQAVALNPHYAAAYFNLGNALADQNRLAEAMDQWRQASTLEPKMPGPYIGLGRGLLTLGEPAEAAHQLETAVQLQPSHPEAWFLLAVAHLYERKYREALDELRKARSLEPGDPRIGSTLVWVLATATDDTVRDGHEALALARALVKLEDPAMPQTLDALAAAYAEVGRFGEAVETARQAARLAGKLNLDELSERILARMKLYEAGLPYRDEGGPVGP